MSACHSECDCCPWTDPNDGSEQHEADCHKLVECDEGSYCDFHFEEAALENRWMLRSSFGAVTGRMSEEDKQDMRDAGRGHLVTP